VNWDTSAAEEYHGRTKHSYESVRASAHRLDWASRPHPFKEYRDLEPLPLPPELEAVLTLGAGVVRTRSVRGGETYHFRTYSSAGALYPVEVYVACAELPSLPAGLYHFHPLERALRRLRSGDVRGALAAPAAAPELAGSLAVVVQSGVLWRTAWKYQARGYRHLWWDAGTMLANLLAAAGLEGLEPSVWTGFVDADVNRLLGVDGEDEAALALLSIGQAAPAPALPELGELDLAVTPLSRSEVAYPEAHAVHAASSLRDVEEVRRFRADGRDDGPLPEVVPAREELERVLRRRGSVREFSPEPIGRETLAEILAAASAPTRLDVPPAAELYGIAHAVEGLERGTFRFDPPARFRVLRRGDFRRHGGYLVLEQPLGALAAATLFLLTDLGHVLERHGNRGYRAAQLEAGIRTGRIYLGAVAHGLGATASTFYDDDVCRFLAPALSPLLAAAVGRPLR
jgi:SagB-type dehydrogenase family enzyme